MEPALGRRERAGRLVTCLEDLLLPAMEPALDRREHHPVLGTGTATGNYLPQWSPPPDDGSTDHDPRPTSDLHGAAMEPTVKLAGASAQHNAIVDCGT